MAYMEKKITRAEAGRYNPILIGIGNPIWRKGEHFASNHGVYGWNFDLIRYGNKVYIAGYRNFPTSTVYPGRTAKKKNTSPFGMVKG